MYRQLRPLLFALNPERAHALALRTAAALGRGSGSDPLVAGAIDLMGLRFPNRVGLAAGFDKNGTAIDGLGRLGFGFLEVGTVTPKPQSGQPAPRLFRLARHEALINRMGFPNDGAEAVAARLRLRRYRGIVGVNIGKNAATPLERAVDDYLACLRTVHAVADYVVVNVSSPNTRELRSLQDSERLEPLLGALLQARETLHRGTGRHVPLLVKLSPDLDPGEWADSIKTLRALRIDGVIATNTTVARDGVGDAGPSRETGGLSGRPLQTAALRAVGLLRTGLGPNVAIIGVGGIDSPASAMAMRAAGADLIQLYTGLIYQGPWLVRRIVRALAQPS